MYKSAYRHLHSTETALLKVVNDIHILLNMDKQRVTLLLLLDLGAAFDTVDHNTLPRRLQNSFGIQGKVLSWFKPYLSAARSAYQLMGPRFLGHSIWNVVYRKGPALDLYFLCKIRVDCSTLFRLIFQTFIALLMALSSSVPVMQPTSCPPLVLWNLVLMIFVLKLNDKSEFLIIGTPQQMAKIYIGSIRVGDCNVSTATSTGNQDSWFDTKLSRPTHLTKLSSSSFYYLYNIRRIRKYISEGGVLRLLCMHLVLLGLIIATAFCMDFPITV